VRAGKRIDALLAKMSVTAEGGTASWSPSIVGGERDFSPKGNGDAMYDTWEGLFHRLADLAEVELERVAGTSGFRPTAREDKEMRNARVLACFDGYHSLFVAYVVGLSEDSVRQIRQKAGRSPITGEKTPVLAEK